jgi:predicted metal-binding protein
MIKWLGENGGELEGTKKYLCVQKKDLFVQIRFFCRLHRGCLGRGSRMLCPPTALNPSLETRTLHQSFQEPQKRPCVAWLFTRKSQAL